jgi:hypothetical protein
VGTPSFNAFPFGQNIGKFRPSPRAKPSDKLLDWCRSRSGQVTDLKAHHVSLSRHCQDPAHHFRETRVITRRVRFSPKFASAAIPVATGCRTFLIAPPIARDHSCCNKGGTWRSESVSRALFQGSYAQASVWLWDDHARLRREAWPDRTARWKVAKILSMMV